MANNTNSPRQKMINLLYLVFIGMLALNVSNEVLDGFELVEESLLRTVKSSTTRNELIFTELNDYHKTNPEKTQIWYELAGQVKTKSDSLFNYTEDLKTRIVCKSDGENGDPSNLKHPDDLNAAFEVMFEPGKNDATRLKNNIDDYRQYVTSLVTDTIKKRIIENNLSTAPSRKAKENKQSWEESMFFQMPVAAAVTLLTKMQNDIRYAEGEVLSTLLKNIDVSDYRVNKMEAQVVPKSQMVMRGGSYEAEIILASVDTTLRPVIIANGREISNGHFTEGAGASGQRTVKGDIQLTGVDGTIKKFPFSTEYFVIEPSATVAPVLMNVLYAGIDNDIRIAVPGVAGQNISATMTNGTLTRKGEGLWTARPNTIGTDAVITVTAQTGGHSQEMAKNTFRVRRLPDPTPYLEYKDDKGNVVQYKKGKLSKSSLSNITELKAAIDDGILNIPFTVVKFETMTSDESMGTFMSDISNGKNFSTSQKERIRQMNRGKVLFIRKIIAKGPDGIERELSTLDITIN